jgi:flagellar hook-associated protein 1 FlgK
LLPAGDSGLATAIRIHRAADPAAGGSLATLRDGGLDPAGRGGGEVLQRRRAADAGRRRVGPGSLQRTTLLNQASGALSAATGVSTDDEIARTVQLQQSYSASAKLISVTPVAVLRRASIQPAEVVAKSCSVAEPPMPVAAA